MKGIVFNIQKFSVNDGPGIRTTVFLKGCPLSCTWCHNPESKRAFPELMYSADKCVMCGKCAHVCPKNVHLFENGKHIVVRENCIACGKCEEECLYEALEIAGKEKSVEEVIDEVLKDKIFYETSNGGVTLSGGEPLLQYEFSLELLKRAKQEGLHTAIETCGYTSEEKIREIASYVDLFLFDYKITNDQLHKKYTGVSNERIIHNLKVLNSLGKQIILRCPIIPGINDTDEHFSGIARIANELGCVSEINVEPYHPLGKSKAEKLGVEYELSDLKFTEEEQTQAWMKAISQKTSKPVKKA
ncbi:MAG: glycyl-radical enzyme activating protein [Clostridiales bacterium]|nr:glycyl-radical enzyme activating protein [Clostridiales bacterium]